jgi:tetratricopeptide (TPR) repeat protein
VQQELAALFKAGHYAELEDRANRLLELYPGSGFAWKVLGAALLVQGKQALQALQKAAGLLPGDVETQNNIGNALKSAGRLDEAVACYGRVLAIRPNYAEAFFNLGNDQMGSALIVVESRHPTKLLMNGSNLACKGHR